MSYGGFGGGGAKPTIREKAAPIVIRHPTVGRIYINEPTLASKFLSDLIKLSQTDSGSETNTGPSSKSGSGPQCFDIATPRETLIKADEVGQQAVEVIKTTSQYLQTNLEIGQLSSVDDSRNAVTQTLINVDVVGQQAMEVIKTTSQCLQTNLEFAKEKLRVPPRLSVLPATVQPSLRMRWSCSRSGQ